MSNQYQRTLSLAGIDISSLSADDLRALVRKILDAGIHGLSFSPYIEGQGPGTQIEAAQIRERLKFIQSHVRWIRSFSCSEGNELIPGIAKENGLKTRLAMLTFSPSATRYCCAENCQKTSSLRTSIASKRPRVISRSATSTPISNLSITRVLPRHVTCCWRTATRSGRDARPSMHCYT